MGLLKEISKRCKQLLCNEKTRVLFTIVYTVGSSEATCRCRLTGSSPKDSRMIPRYCKCSAVVDGACTHIPVGVNANTACLLALQCPKNRDFTKLPTYTPDERTLSCYQVDVVSLPSSSSCSTSRLPLDHMHACMPRACECSRLMSPPTRRTAS